MLARVYSCAVIGLDGVVVEVEVDTTQGFPGMTIVGLPDAAVQESRERVQAAVRNAGVPFPRKRLVVNLAPAAVRKEGPSYDLPIALGVLIFTGMLPSGAADGMMVVGELSLDGTVRHARGVLPMAATARSAGFKRIVVPETDAAEAALIPDLEVLPVSSLSQLYNHLAGRKIIPPQPRSEVAYVPPVPPTDFGEIKGQEHVKRAMEVAAAGGHNGEISLAHRGVLFLDELPEFGMRVLEVLRQPIEDKIVTISRAQGSLTFPANFQLIAAMNPCPCGYYGDPVKPCTCSNMVVSKYQKRISGPLLDRIDIHIEVPRVEYEKLADARFGESSETIRERVEAARDRQRERFDVGTQNIAPVQITCNADMRPAEVRKFCALDETGHSLMQTAMNQMQLSARAYHRVLKLARTIADLAGSESIQPTHLAEALQYRPKFLTA